MDATIAHAIATGRTGAAAAAELTVRTVPHSSTWILPLVE
jgi:hypothetical protein